LDFHVNENFAPTQINNRPRRFLVSTTTDETFVRAIFYVDFIRVEWRGRGGERMDGTTMVIKEGIICEN
jgi:hypothetical protein